MEVVQTLPCLSKFDADFWGTATPHVKLPDGEIKVVLQDVFVAFCGIADNSNRSKKLIECLTEIKHGGVACTADQGPTLAERLPANEMTEFHLRLPSNKPSAKISYAVPQLWAKHFLLHYFPKAPKVASHASESLELDSAVRGGVLAAAGGVLANNSALRTNPVEQAARLGGTGISVEEANSVPTNMESMLNSRPVSPRDEVETTLAARDAGSAGLIISLAASPDRDDLIKRKFEADLLDQQLAIQERTLELAAKREESEARVKRARMQPFVDCLKFCKDLGFDDDDDMIPFIKRQAKNTMSFMIQADNTVAQSNQPALLAPGSSASAGVADNPFPWHANTRMARLGFQFKGESRKKTTNEQQLGKAMAKAYRERYNKEPKSREQVDQNGRTFMCKEYTNAECDEVLDEVIRAFVGTLPADQIKQVPGAAHPQ